MQYNCMTQHNISDSVNIVCLKANTDLEQLLYVHKMSLFMHQLFKEQLKLQ